MVETNSSLPKTIQGVEELEQQLSEPTDDVLAMMDRIEGDVVILGVGGKMGPTLARMVRRASDRAGTRRRVVGVSRFSSPSQESQLQENGIETVRADLLDANRLKVLPDAPNVIYMAGIKFGSTGHESLTWAINTYLPAPVCQRYRNSRIVVFSTGNVYGLTPVQDGGAIESDMLNPTGEYAMSCLGRERIFEYFSRTMGTAMAIIRLNYAFELRYGVLVDMAQKVWANEPIDLSMGHVNTIWQGDANAMILRSLEHVASPPLVVNVGGTDILSVRLVCEQFGQLMDKPVCFVGQESPDALLSNGQLGIRLFGSPRVSIERAMLWIADWVMRGGESLSKPTHFEVRDGRF